VPGDIVFFDASKHHGEVSVNLCLGQVDGMTSMITWGVDGRGAEICDFSGYSLVDSEMRYCLKYTFLYRLKKEGKTK